LLFVSTFGLHGAQQKNWRALAAFRLAHLVSKEGGTLAICERIRKATPGGRGSAKEWACAFFVSHLRQAPSYVESFGQSI
jgi:hypothetical protein